MGNETSSDQLSGYYVKKQITQIKEQNNSNEPTHKCSFIKQQKYLRRFNKHLNNIYSMIIDSIKHKKMTITSDNSAIIDFSYDRIFDTVDNLHKLEKNCNINCYDYINTYFAERYPTNTFIKSVSIKDIRVNAHNNHYPGYEVHAIIETE